MASNKEKQKLFALYLSKGMNDRDAAIKAGYSEKTIDKRLKNIKETVLKKLDVKEVIIRELDKGNTDLLKDNYWQPKDILKWWSEILENPDVKMLEKIKVSELLAKCHGMFVTKVEIKNTNYSDILNNARKRLSDVNTINVTPDVVDDNTADNIVN